MSRQNLRVSTIHQDLEKNKSAILKLANDKKSGHVEFIEEKISGKINWKQRKIGKIINKLQKGDTIILSELSRLGRSMLEIMQILAIAVEKGIHIYSVKNNWTLDSSLQSKILAMVFSLAAEIERELISQRTTEALKSRKEKGIKLGRPKGSGKSRLDKYKQEIIGLLSTASTQKYIANRYHISAPTLCNWLKKNGIYRTELLYKKASGF